MSTTRRNFMKAGAGLAVIAGTGLSTGLVGAARADTLALRYNRWLPATHHIDTDVFAPWFKEVKELTDGRVDIEFTASSLGPIPRQYEIVGAGIVDLSFGSEALTPGRFPLSEIVELPFLGNSTYANSVAYWRVFEAHFAKTNPYPQVKLLGLATLPSYNIYTIKKPVRTVADLQGMKIRATGTTMTDTLAALGAEAVPTNITELHDVLSKGIVDGMLGNDDQVRSFGVAKYFDYKTEIPGGITTISTFFCINKDKWAQISQEDQTAIQATVGERHAEDIGRAMDKSVAIGQAQLKDAGTKVIVADQTFIDELRGRTEFLEERWLKKAAKLNVDGEQALTDLRAWVGQVGNG